MDRKLDKAILERKRQAEEHNCVIVVSIQSIIDRIREITPQKHAPEMKQLLKGLLTLTEGFSRNESIVQAIGEMDRNAGHFIAKEALENVEQKGS